MQATVILKPSNFHQPAVMSAARTPPTQASAWGGSPWGQVATPVCPLSLEQVMSEELADQLQREEHNEHMKEFENFSSNVAVADTSAVDGSDETDPTKDDYLMAQMLQQEFDKQHDTQLEKEEAIRNGDSKLQISFKNYKTVHPSCPFDEEEVDEEEDEDYWDEDVDKDDPVPEFNKSGVSGKGSSMVTKHDTKISAQRNANRVMEQFPPEFETGDGGKIKMRLPNHVYNELKKHSVEETKRSKRVHEKKEHSTAEMAVDAKTRLILYKLVNSGILESIGGVVSSGKEAVVFHGTGGSNTDALVPEECAIKVFKTTLSEFKNRCDYVRGDNRFMKDEFKKQNPRKIIKIWAEKELANLKKMENCGISCPKVVVLKRHVLLMEFLGAKQVPAPKLRDAELTPEEAEWAYADCVQGMTKLFREAGLVHADLSEYNMLWHNNKVYFIDVAQGVEIMHPRAMEFLLRDCANVSKFFKSLGVHGVKNRYELFNEITSLELQGKGREFLAQIQRFEKNEEKLRSEKGKDYNFNYFFERSQQEREDKKKKLDDLFEDSNSDEDEEDDEEEIIREPWSQEVEEKLQVLENLETDELSDTEELPDAASVSDH